MIKFLIFWDIFWRNGRRVLKKFLPELKKQFAPDFIIGNSENLTSWKAWIVKHIKELQELWFDCLTWWNHSFTNLKDNKEYLDLEDGIQIRPANYYNHPDYKVPWKGYKIVEKNWNKILVINLLWNAFIGWQVYSPFLKVDEILNSLTNESFDAIIIDYHRETTAESYVMSEYLDSRVSFVYWTHTHVQTNDEHILKWWTWMITDVWMTWSLHSSVGQTFESRLPNFLTWINIFTGKPEQELGDWVINAIYVEIENKKCIKIEKIRIRE